MHFVETTRGCPWDCEFCAVTNAFGGSYRNRPVRRSASQELRSLRPFGGLLTLKNVRVLRGRQHREQPRLRQGTPHPHCRPQVEVVWPGLHEYRPRPGDPAPVPEERLHGHLHRVRNPLHGDDAVDRQKPNRPDDYLEIVQRIHDHGIGVDGSFVFGFDTDDEGVFDRTLEFVLRAKLEIAYFSILTPYPGTRLTSGWFRKNRLLTRDWSFYDANHVVFRPKTFTPDKLLEYYHRVLKEFYSYPSIFRRLWGSKAKQNFFYPMNFGFRASVHRQVKSR